MTESFSIIARKGRARRGVLRTKHGEVQTPAFMPVGTIGAVKGVDSSDLKSANAEIILCNTYHLILRPGAEMISRRGGLHNFIGWDRPILTDSGGCQVMSLSSFRKLEEKGVTFTSHLDGNKIFLSPEEALHAQNLFACDIQMVLDVCPKSDATEDEIRHSINLSHKWAERSVDFEKPSGILRFGIVQGGFDEKTRIESAKFIIQLPFDGFAIGGLSVGEPEDVMFKMLEVVLPLLPEDKPRYLMGVGMPEQIQRAVELGIDMFDCVEPTRIARHGTLWSSNGKIRIARKEYEEDDTPVDSSCSCLLCRTYSKAYLRHIYRIGEPLYIRLASLHNLTYMLNMMEKLKASY